MTTQPEPISPLDFFALVDQLARRVVSRDYDGIVADLIEFNRLNAEAFSIQCCSGCGRWQHDYGFSLGGDECNSCHQQAQEEAREDQETINFVRSR